MARRTWTLEDLPARYQRQVAGDAAPNSEYPEPPKRSKYGAVKAEYKNVTYDSKREAARAAQLDMSVSSGEVLFWLRQVPIRFSSGVTYRLDFQVFYADGRVGWEDVKGFMTETWKLKMRLLEDEYPHVAEQLEVLR